MIIEKEKIQDWLDSKGEDWWSEYAGTDAGGIQRCIVQLNPGDTITWTQRGWEINGRPWSNGQACAVYSFLKDSGLYEGGGWPVSGGGVVAPA